MNGSEIDEPSSGRPSRAGLRLRIAGTAAVLVLTAFSAARFASASFDEVAIPIGDVASLDGIVSGTVHLAGGRLVIYSGDRFQSNESSLAVNFAGGGSVILCPHSQLQILAANSESGLMLAFQEGGSQQPFQLHASDVVMTPDWRIQMAGNVPPGEFGTLQLSTSRRGELCLSANAKAGQSFRVSELAGDSVFDVTGQSNIRIAGGHIENSPGGCSCAGVISEAGLIPPPQAVTGSSPVTGAPVARPEMTHPAAPALSSAAVSAPSVKASASPPPGSPQQSGAPIANPSVPERTKQRQHPQDVVGYVRAFIHLLFGR